MKTRIIKGWRQFTTEPQTGREKEPNWDFTELLQVMRNWR